MSQKTILLKRGLSTELHLYSKPKQYELIYVKDKKSLMIYDNGWINILEGDIALKIVSNLSLEGSKIFVDKNLNPEYFL